MTPILLVLVNVLASLGLLGILVAFGVPIYTLARRFGLTDRASLGLCWLFGLTWLSVFSWYGIAFGIRPTAIYRGLVILAPIIGGLALVCLRPRPEQRLRGGTALMADVGLDLAAFAVTVLVYTGLIFSKLRPGDLPWATILDGDLYVYLKSAAWLSLFPVVVPSVGWTDFQSFVARDVFGCFNLLAFARFALHAGLESLPIPTLGVAVGMIGVAVSRSCRLAFRLGPPLSIGVALTLTTGPLFLYVVLNYFMSQIVFMSVLLTTALQSLELHGGGRRARAGLGLVMAAGAIATLLSYDVWVLQFAVLIAALFGVVESATAGGSRWRRSVRLISSVLARIALALGAMALVAPVRLVDVVDKLKFDSVSNVVGWALPFVDLDLLLGLSVEWQGMDVPRPAMAGPTLGFLLLLAVLSLAVVKLDREPGRVVRRLALGCFCATLLAYLAVWLRFGETYQQWKFASTLPLGFGFVVLASTIRLIGLGTSRRLAGAAATTFLAACVMFNVHIARDGWMASLAHHSAALATIAQTLDAAPEDGPVHVTLDEFGARHVALVMLNHRTATFDGTSMFGLSPPPPASGRRIGITAPCGTAGTEAARYAVVPEETGWLPVFPAEHSVAFSGDVANCVALSGFGEAQSWGRSMEGPIGAIRFRCGCPPAPGGYELVMEAGLLEGVERRTVHFTIGGVIAQVEALTGPKVRDIVVPLPSGLGSGDEVDLLIEDRPPGPVSDDSNGFVVNSISIRRGASGHS